MEEKIDSNNTLKLINQGTYGCIFHPGINCKGEKENDKYITKIQKSSRAIENEIKISKLIQKIPRYASFFAPIIKQCNVRIAQKLRPSIQQCDIFKKVSVKEMQEQKYVSNKVRYLGDMDLKNYILSKTTWQEMGKTILNCHLDCLQAYKLLSDRQIIHYDVKGNNIMFDQNLNKPILIDFGISVHLPSLHSAEDFHSAFYALEAYPYWCVEITFCSYIFTTLGLEESKETDIDENGLKNVINIFLNGVKSKNINALYEKEVLMIAHEPQNFANQIYNKYLEFFKPFIGQKWFSIYKYFISEHFYQTWDNYGLCACMLILLDDLRMENSAIFKDLVKNESMKKYVNFLADMLYSLPTERKSLTESMKIIKQLSSGK